nr:putative ribonuclease H-like domain-containing protein [Tanacetum cinerariifolium]
GSRLVFIYLFDHQSYNSAKCKGFKVDQGASSFTFKISMLLLLLLATLHMTILYWKQDNKQVTIQFRGGLLGIVIPTASVFCLSKRGLQAQVRVFGTDKGTKILNQTLHAFFVAEGILHQTSVARTPKQNGVVERRNRTLVEAARTMLSATKVPLFFWAKAIATACITQNLIPRHEKTPYHIINDRKPSVKFFHIFGSICYIVRDGENLDKIKEKGDECIFVGLMFDELLNGSSKVVSKSSAVCSADAPIQRQHHTTPLNNHTTPTSTCQVPTLEPTVTSSESINQADMYDEND